MSYKYICIKNLFQFKKNKIKEQYTSVCNVLIKGFLQLSKQSISFIANLLSSELFWSSSAIYRKTIIYCMK